MIGVASTAPNWPGLVIVNVPPWTSSGCRRFSRARAARSPIAAAIPSTLSRCAWRITGTKGTLLWDGYDKFEANKVIGEDGFFRELAPLEVPEPEDESQTHGHASVIADFLKAVKTGSIPETAGSDNIKSLAMVFAAIESARSKSRVEIKV